MRTALMKRGWTDAKSKNAYNVDIKFTYCWYEINYNQLKPHTLVNHCYGEVNATCKNWLGNTLWEDQLFKHGMLDEGQLSDFYQGVDSFFPKQFVLTEEGMNNFRQEMLMVRCESYLKLYANQKAKKPKDDFDLNKLAIFANILLRKIDFYDNDERNSDSTVITKDEERCINGFFDAKKLISSTTLHPSIPQPVDKAFVRSLLENIAKLFPQTSINGTDNLWIVKPSELSRGRGIKLFDSYQDVSNYIEHGTNQWVAQKYIERPLLLNNKKFDLRVWVIVPCWNPLQVNFYKQCYVRFATSDYDPNNLKNLFSHLTNNSI